MAVAGHGPGADLDDEELLELARRWPLGTFYRVNPFRLDDMQSAITELYAICASAVVHDGWAEPQIMRRNGEAIHVIARRVDAKQVGGHALALVGYNEVGFLVQNSWGTDWGKGGFATLPYEDWLDSAYDAWVTRPGVPKTPFASGRTRTAAATGGELVTAPAPDLKRLANYVVNLGNQGLLSTTGSFVSTPAQIDRAFGHMQRWHDQWLAKDGSRRRVRGSWDPRAGEEAFREAPADLDHRDLGAYQRAIDGSARSSARRSKPRGPRRPRLAAAERPSGAIPVRGPSRVHLPCVAREHRPSLPYRSHAKPTTISSLAS
jgi:Papain family cysteine protease